jgi:threonine synthase
MLYIKTLKCSKCGKEHDPSEGLLLCPKRDYGRLDIIYDYEALKEILSRSILEERRAGVWKYHELLPAEESHAPKLGGGNTPLIKALRLGETLKSTNLFIKDETRGPTGSFKDRSMTVGVAKAVELGYTTTVTASSGNAAIALAAHSAAAGLECTAFVLDFASRSKLAQLINYGARVVKVKGLGKEDPTVKMMIAIMDKYKWYPCPSFGPFNPYQVEGPKTISYEIAEQLGWKVPDWILVPSGSGCLMAGLWKGFKDLKELGLVDSMPKLAVVQSTGNAPIVRAYVAGRAGHDISPWEEPKTIATGLSDPYPWDGDAALQAVRDTDGTCVAVPDKLILVAQKLLASREGVFGEPTGVVGIAGFMTLLEKGVIRKTDCVVVPVTGSGLKETGIIEKETEKIPTVEPIPEQFDRILRGI